MRLVDPTAAPIFGLDSGMRAVKVSRQEAATLRRAAAIVEAAHDLVVAELGDGHYDLPDAADLCLAGPALRALADGEVEW